MAHDQDNNSASLLFALILLLSAGAIYRYSEILFPEKKQGEASLSSKQPIDVDMALNKHLHETNKILERERFKREIENSFTLPRVGNLVPTKPPEGSDPLELDATDRSAGGGINRQQTVSPETIIQNELADKQAQDRQDRIYRQEYIRQFVQNAKDHGWNVEVDSSGVVRRVTPVPGSNQDQTDNPESSASH